MANPATTADIESRWRPLSSQEEVNASTFLDDAWEILQMRVAGLDALITAGTVTAAAAKAVLCAMVLRVLKNPDGKRQEAIDDYSWTRDQAVADGSMYVSAEELDLLTPASSSTAFTVRPYGVPGYSTSDLTWDSPL